MTNLIFLFFFITLLILLFYNYSSNHIIILNKNELLNLLLKNSDNYYDKFEKKDLIVRNVNNIEEYKLKIRESVCEPPISIKNKLKKTIINANNKLLLFKEKYKHFNNVDINKLYNIQWKVGIICNNNYENGLPHTRNNVIIISLKTIYNSSIESLSKTLIHEKVHIYQKIYKNDLSSYLKNNNFTKIKKIEENDYIRANPDTDNNIYIDNKNRIYQAKYLPNATDIKDVEMYNNDQKYEHPFELMAIELSDEIFIH